MNALTMLTQDHNNVDELFRRFEAFDEDQLTERRKVVEERYAKVIAALYDGSSDVHVQAVVTYENGQTGFVERTLPIREV